MKEKRLDEEALVEEIEYAIAHIAHAEQHLIDYQQAANVDGAAVELLDDLRAARQVLAAIYMDMIGAEAGDDGGERRSAGEEKWCLIKHLLMSIVHCEEALEKLARRHRRGDKDALEKYKEVLSVRGKLKEALEKVTGVSREECVRCEEDLDVEEALALHRALVKKVSNE